MQRVNELYAQIEQCTDDTKKLVLLFDLATSLLNFDEKRTQDVADELGALAERLNNNIGRSYYHSTRGRLMFRKSLLTEATREFELASEKANLTDDISTQASCLDSLGIAYRIQKKYKEAETATMRALEIFKSVPNTENYQSVCYNNLGTLYKDMEAFDMANEVYKAGLALASSIGNERMACNLQNNVAGVAIMTHNYEEGLYHSQLSLAGFRKLRHKNGEVHALMFVGHCTCELGNYAKAMQHYLACLKLLKSVSDKPVEAQVYKGLGNVYAKMHAYEEALKNYTKAMEISLSAHDFEEACEIQLVIAKLYHAMDNSASAEWHLNNANTLAAEKGLDKMSNKVLQIKQSWTKVAG